MTEMNSRIEKVVNIYRKAAQFPSASSAKISKKDESLLIIVSNWSQRNLERGKMTNFRRTHLVSRDTFSLIRNFTPVDTTTEICSCVSESEKFLAVIRDASSDSSKCGSKKKQYLEIWRHGHLWKNLDLTTLNIHGDVYADSTFGCMDWSPCEGKVLYIAEKKRPKATPLYSVKPYEEKSDCEPKESDSTRKGAEYEYIEDWGEQLTDKSQPVLVVYDIETEVPVVWEEGLPEGYSPGQVTWIPNQKSRGMATGDMDEDEDSNGVVGVAWKSEPRRLGLVFCTNREGILFHANSAGQIRVIRGADGSVSPRSPRFSPDGSSLIWLERMKGGTHYGSSRLMQCAWPPPYDGPVEAEVLVDFVPGEIEDDTEAFRGIFCHLLPKRPFSKDRKHLVMNSPQETSVHPYIVDLEKRTVSRIKLSVHGKQIDFEDNSVAVLDVDDDILVCCHSRLNKPHSLLIAKLTGGDTAAISYPCVPEEFNKLETRIFHLKGDDTGEMFSAIYYGPTDQKLVPLIVMPHGGPHSSFACDYSAGLTMFGLLGFGMLLVNYRGSSGQWETTLKSLPGKIGEQDVADVRKATSEVLSAIPSLDSSHIFLFGGSHGGYLVTMLSGLYPTDYKAVVTRNPVIDVASMCVISDIPDWCTVESGVGEWMGDDSPSTYCDNEALTKMRMVSPIVHASSVQAPTLVMIGRGDMRVPPSQGLLYYRCLKAHNVKTRLLEYDDCHSLSKVPNELDNLVNSALWFVDHIGPLQQPSPATM